MSTKIRISLLIFFLALSARLLYLGQIKDSFLFCHPIVDSGIYDYSGALTARDTISIGYAYSFHKIPLYQFFLAVIYKIGGHNIYLASLIQAVMGAFNCCLIYLLGKGAFNRAVGTVAGIVSSLYWPLIAFGAKLLPVNLAIFFALLSVVSLNNILSGRRSVWVFASGLFLGLASLARGNMLLVFPIMSLCIAYYFHKGEGIKRGLRYMSFFLVGFLIVIAPTMIKDYSETRNIAPAQKNYGIGVYFGLDLEHINVKPGSAWKKIMREMLSKDLIAKRDRNTFWFRKTGDFIANNPGLFLRNLFTKMYILLNFYEFSPRENIHYFRGQSRFLSFALFNFGSVAAFAILGMVAGWKSSRRKAWPIYVFVITYYISLLPFMPLARYRLPLSPFFIIFASYGAFVIFTDVFLNRWRTVLQYTLVVAPLLVLTNMNPFYAYLEQFSRPLYYRGLVHLSFNDIEGALADFKDALKKHPADADIYEAIGDAYLRRNNTEAAQISYIRALAAEHEFPEVLEKLGVTYARQGNVEQAKAIFEEVLSSYPTERAGTHINLGNCYKLEGDYEAAEREYTKAIDIAPHNLQALNRLALLYEETGNPKAAEFRAQYNTRIEKLEGRIEGLK